MANDKIYTRAYSKSSAGQYVSAKGCEGGPLSDTALVEEFRNHANKSNREPTALVSGSFRIVDTLTRAFNKCYKDGESPADIWIAFIKVPSTINGTATRIHAAKDLAEKCEHSNPNKFFHEVVFEWAIPETYVQHKVSLETLMSRGLQRPCLPELSTPEVRLYFLQQFKRDSPWEVGVKLGCFARKFGARAPLDWISHQLFHDCTDAEIWKTVNFRFFCDLNDGIDTSLNDWWLSDIEFFLDYEEFEEWRDVREDSMTWDLIEVWETWHDVDCDGRVRQLSAEEEVLYDEKRNKMFVEHEKKRMAIEREAVKIGL